MHDSVCPNCGYCPTCGRRNTQPNVWPMIQPNPWITGPIWKYEPPYTSCGNTSINPLPNVQVWNGGLS